MTGRPELQPAREWSTALASALDEITDRLGAVARQLAEGWPDARGREWAERVLLVRRTLGREADAAAELARAVDRAADGTEPAAPDTDPSTASGVARLGSTDARRADDRRGVRIPRLNDAADDAG